MSSIRSFAGPACISGFFLGGQRASGRALSTKRFFPAESISLLGLIKKEPEDGMPAIQKPFYKSTK